MEFPLFNTLELSDGATYNLNDPAERHKYFHAKLGTQIDELKEYLDTNSFVGFLLAKKQGGKGTYSKMFEEVIGAERFAHISVGDTVRKAQEKLQSSVTSQEVISYIKSNYRGFITVEEAIDSVINHTQEKLIPTELILVLLKMEIEKSGRKGLFIDGLPRNLDQVSYSLYFRDLINFRYDPDFFVLIDVPETLIKARMDGRLVCPLCQTSKNLSLNPTKFVSYDLEKSEFYLLCDNTSCEGFEKARLNPKIGDNRGLEHLKDRLDLDGKLIDMATNLHGIPLVYLNSTVPVKDANKVIEDYELQKSFKYSLKNDQIEKEVFPFELPDDNGENSNVVMAATVVVSLISQIHSIVVGNKI